MKKILLIIDDDRELSNLLASYFECTYSIAQAFDGEEGLQQFAKVKPDVVLLDVMMSKKDGITVLKSIRQCTETPILMLTAMSDDIDKILGLELGANDYVTKPCNQRELAARLKNLLSQSVQQNTDNMGIYIDEMRRQISVHGEWMTLTAVEYDILLILSRAMLSVVEKDQLFEHVFQRERQAFDRSLDVHISNIRKKLANIVVGDSPAIVIQTLRGKGYRLHPAV